MTVSRHDHEPDLTSPCLACYRLGVREREARDAREDRPPAGDGGCSDESPNPARAQRVNRNLPDWRSRL